MVWPYFCGVASTENTCQLYGRKLCFMADESKPAEGGIVSDKFLADNAAALRDAATEVTLPINFLPPAAQGAWQVGPNSISVQANPDLAKAAASISAMIQAGISGGAAAN